jgi:hypothetical protein
MKREKKQKTYLQPKRRRQHLLGPIFVFLISPSSLQPLRPYSLFIIVPVPLSLAISCWVVPCRWACRLTVAAGVGGCLSSLPPLPVIPVFIAPYSTLRAVAHGGG